ncbi:MAG: hypothetical protein NTY24_03525, partial [Mycobacterium sp.]|nr:hypothetical protein [Mycobacterium sp.]
MSEYNALTPLVAWQRLRTGNESMATNGRGGRVASADERPIAAVFRCADAGLASEVVFGQTTGSLVEVSTWGHVVDAGVIASLEYSVVT